MLLNVEMYARSISHEKALLSQVILLSINDACHAPDPKVRKEHRNFVSNEQVRMHTDTFTALRFLFDTSVSGLDEYAAWLDIDPNQFRRKLVEMMQDNGPNIVNGYSSMQRRSFRMNKKIWEMLQRQNNLDPNIEVADEHD